MTNMEKTHIIRLFGEIENLDLTDNIIKNAEDMKDYKFPYGPMFLTICGILSKISCSSTLLFLYEFKILNFITYLLTVYLVYKLTKKKKLTIAFCFNPLILLEVLTNVHNDIFVIFFALLGIVFVREAEKTKNKFMTSELEFICGLLFIAFSALIKYVAILILPFVILYRLRNESLIEKIINGIIYLALFLSVLYLPYIPYFKNFYEIFSGAILQTGKLKDSIYMIISMVTGNNQKIVSYCYSIGFFVLLYIFIIKVLTQIFRKNNFHEAMENSYSILFWLIFIGLTNLTSWYLIWLFIPVFWTNGKKLKNLIYIGFLYELTYTIFYFVNSDASNYQIFILPFIGFMMILRSILSCFKRNNRKVLS